MRDEGRPNSSDRDAVLALIVAHALDDLEAAHVDLPTALRLTALAAWRECERANGRVDLEFSDLRSDPCRWPPAPPSAP